MQTFKLSAMIRKIIIFALLCLITIPTVVYSQIDTTVVKQQGEIVMTQEELLNFLSKVAEAKRAKMEADLENEYYENLEKIYLRKFDPQSSASLTSNKSINDMSREELIREIDALNARYNNLYGYDNYGREGRTTIITSPNEQYHYLDDRLMPATSGYNTNDLRWKLDSLQQRVGLLSNNAIIPEREEEINRLNREIDLVQDSLISSVPLTPEAKEIMKRYGSSEMKVFFENDISEVSSQYQPVIRDAAIVLRQNPHINIVLRGFASPLGSAKYNYDLSMRRNEAVKRVLIDYGVFPDQITSVFYGIDRTTSEAKARRVDMRYIIK